MSCFLKHHADIMQAGNETAAVDLVAAGCAVAEAYNIGAMLAQAGRKGELLGVVGE